MHATTLTERINFSRTPSSLPDSSSNLSLSLVTNNRTGNIINIAGLTHDLSQQMNQNTSQFQQLLKEVMSFLSDKDQISLSNQLSTLVNKSSFSPINSASQKTVTGNISSLGELASLNSSAFEKSLTESNSDNATDITSNSVLLNQNIAKDFQNQFSSKASDKQEFHSFMKEVYGESYNIDKAENLRLRTLAGDTSWLPKIEYVSSDTLGGANGAYYAESSVIYINSDLKGTSLASETFIEEIGHHIDTLVKDADTTGDEGEMFRRVLSNEALTATDISQIKTENDLGTIMVNGNEISVEFWNPVKSISNAAKSVGSGIGNAASAVGNAVTTVGKTIVNTSVDVVSNVGNGAINFGIELSKGNVVDAFSSLGSGVLDAGESLLNGADKIIFQTPQNLLSEYIDSTRMVFNGLTELIPYGDQVRKVTDRIFDAKRTIIQAGFGIARDIFRAPFEISMDFVRDIGTSIGHLFRGEFGEAAKQFGMSFVNRGVGIIGRGVDVGIRGLHALVDIAGMIVGEPPAKELSADQEAYVRNIYGDSIDYSQIRIRRGGITDAFNMRAHVVGNTIYMPSNFFNADGTLTAIGLETLGHEVGHIWQNQNGGGDYMHEALGAQLVSSIKGDGSSGAYNWVDAMREGIAFENMNPEQQASLAEAIGTAFTNDGTITAADFPTLTNQEFEFLMNAWDMIQSGKGAP